MKTKKFFIIGVAGSLGLLVLYFAVLTLANSFSHAISQFSQFWYWILILAAGFGTQVGLYTFIKTRQKVSGGILAASGSVSTGSMIACCLHHLTDVLPLMGLAAASLFLIKYQLFFLILGVISNFIGITIMLEIIYKNKLSNSFKKIAIAASLPALAIVFFLANNQQIISTINLPSKTDNQNNITFEVTPLGFRLDKEVEFEIGVDTHSGSLDFDLTDISFLEDDLGNQYFPLDWQGTPAGGHHLAGMLSFPKVNNQAKTIKLTIQDAYLRIFEWDLK